jgi:D-threo-aldose 1-dehydrogenase
MLAALAEAHGVTLPDLAVQFPLQHPAVVSVVLGTRTRAHVESSIERYEAAVPDELWRELA